MKSRARRILAAICGLLLFVPVGAAPAQEFAEFLDNAEKNDRTLVYAWELWVKIQASKARKKHRCGLLVRGARTMIAEYADAVDRDPERFAEARLDLRIVPVLRSHSCPAVSTGNRIVAHEEQLRVETQQRGATARPAFPLRHH